VTLFNSASTRGGWISTEEIAAFLTACEMFLRKNRPDVVWTYGGDLVSVAIQQLTKRLDIPIVFGLHNFAYLDAEPFQTADYVIVPSEFCRQHYWNELGLASLKLPPVLDPERVECKNGLHQGGLGTGRLTDEDDKMQNANLELPPSPRSPPAALPLNTVGEGSRQYVTFVNPQVTKGLYVFARIAEVLARQRPEIPVLVVEGRNGPGWASETGIDLASLGNLTIRPNTTDPRTFYADTKLILLPSLLNESFGLVAAEAMMNGIPVLASNRGALAETVGCAGFLFDIPVRYTPKTREMPSAEEVEPWVETIIRLWDDAAAYGRWSDAAHEHAQQWHRDRLAPVYREFFMNITHQPGPPLVPKEAAL
jgi:glycosyltransferase involved in cell wall biosynthesis